MMLRWLRDWLEDMRFVAKWDRLVAEASTDPASVKLPKRVETPDSLESAVQILRRIGLREPKPMRPVERGGPSLEAMRLTGPLPLLRAVARKLNVPWRSAEYYVWFAASGAGKFPAQIGVASTADWAEVFRFMATCGGDTDLQDGLIAVLSELDAACPISARVRLFCVDHRLPIFQ